MATYVPAKRAAEYIDYVGLPSQFNTKVFQSNPTLAAGDVKISKDGGAFANLTNLPTVTPAGGKAVKFVLTSTETDCDQCVVLFSDGTGSEWCDVMVPLQFSAQQVDELLAPTTAGRKLDVSAGGCAGIDLANVEGQSTTLALSGTTVAAVSGAVGSVTGNVGGNVIGSVGSVVGLKKNTARPAFPFLMRSSSDHVTPVEGLTVQARRLIDNGTWADCANAVVEKGSGAYVIDLAASDLDGNNILFRFSAAGADPCFVTVATST